MERTVAKFKAYKLKFEILNAALQVEEVGEELIIMLYQ
jgi:hypothetical protein